jgi:hypothetical protein
LLERLARAERRTRARTASDRAKAVAEAILSHGADRPDGLRLLSRLALEQRTAATDPGTAVARIIDWISALLRRSLKDDGLEPGLAPYLAHAIWGATTALATQAHGQRRPNRERLASLAVSAVPARPLLPTGQWPAAT